MDSINFRYCFLMIFFPLVSAHQVSSNKCLWEYILSKLKTNESKISELPMTTELMLLKSDQNIDPDVSICENRQHKKTPTANHKTNKMDGKKKIYLRTVAAKKKSLLPDNIITQAEGAEKVYFDPYVKSRPSGFLENFLTKMTFLQIFPVAVAIIVILLLATRHRGFLSSSSFLKFSIIRKDIRHQTRSTQYELPLNQMSPRRKEEIASNFSDDELAWITSSSMVCSHLQKLVNGIKESKPEENLEKYLTEEFLQMISDRIAEDGYMRSNFQDLLTAESLLKLGKFNYQRTKNPGNLNRII